jgi:hypothetical protein
LVPHLQHQQADDIEFNLANIERERVDATEPICDLPSMLVDHSLIRNKGTRTTTLSLARYTAKSSLRSSYIGLMLEGRLCRKAPCPLPIPPRLLDLCVGGWRRSFLRFYCSSELLPS